MTWGMAAVGGIGLVGGYLSNRSQERQNTQNLQAQQNGTVGQQTALNWATTLGNRLMDRGVYQGQLTAPWNGWMRNAGQMVANSAGQGGTAMYQAQTGARTAQGYRPMMAQTADTRPNAGSQFQSQYFNPFLRQVGGAMMGDMDRARQMQIMGDEDKAIAAKAYGGARHGVVDAETNRGFYDTLGKNLTGLYAQGFDKSSSLGMQDADRWLKSDTGNMDRYVGVQQGNQKTGIEGARVGLDGSRLSMDVGNSQNANYLRSAGLYGDFARGTQAYDQAAVDRQRDLWNEWRDLPVRASGMVTAAAGGGSVQANSGPNGYQSFLNGAGNTIGMLGWAGSMYGSPNRGTAPANTGFGTGSNWGNQDYGQFF